MKHSCTVDEVLLKVLEDVDGIEHKKAVSRETSKRYRKKHNNEKGGGDTSFDTTEKRREEKKREDNKEQREKDPYPPFEKLVFDSWNNLCKEYPMLPKCRSITPGRRTHLKKRFTNKDFVKNITAAIQGIPKSDFLIGKNDRDWKIDFDFLIKNDENYTKILEGKYGGVSENSKRDEVQKQLKEAGLI